MDMPVSDPKTRLTEAEARAIVALVDEREPSITVTASHLGDDQWGVGVYFAGRADSVRREKVRAIAAEVLGREPNSDEIFTSNKREPGTGAGAHHAGGRR